MSDAFWRRVFQADPRTIGRTLRINGLPFTVVGGALRQHRDPDGTRHVRRDAQRQLHGAMAQLVEAFPDHSERYREAMPSVDAGIGLAPRDQARLAPTLRVLVVLVALLRVVRTRRHRRRVG